MEIKKCNKKEWVALKPYMAKMNMNVKEAYVYAWIENTYSYCGNCTLFASCEGIIKYLQLDMTEDEFIDTINSLNRKGYVETTQVDTNRYELKPLVPETSSRNVL